MGRRKKVSVDVNGGQPTQNSGGFLSAVPDSPEKANKITAVMNAVQEIKKAFGEGSIMTYSSSSVCGVARASSGILPVDLILGGGYPVGRIIEIYGPESSGKTTISLKAIAARQACGEICAFIDAEHALDPIYAKALGVNLDELLISQPDNGEMALEVAESLIRSGGIGMIVIDSVAALVPKKELEGDMGDSNVGLHARLMSQAMRKLTGIVAKTNCIVIFINQIREKVGVAWGNPEVTTGGRALKFYASVRLDVRRKEQIKDGADSVGNRTVVKTVKNKTYPPFKVAEFDIMFGKGPDETGSIVDFAVEQGTVQKGGAWYTYNGSRFHGKNEIVDYFNSPEGKPQLEALRNQILNEFNQGNMDLSYAPGEEDLKENTNDIPTTSTQIPQQVRTPQFQPQYPTENINVMSPNQMSEDEDFSSAPPFPDTPDF